MHNRCLERQARLDSAIDSEDNFHEEIFVTAQAIPIDNMDGHQATQSHGRSDAEQEMWDGFVPTDNAFEIELVIKGLTRFDFLPHFGKVEP